MRVRITVRRQDERLTREVEATTENLGFGGAFLRMDPPLAPETRVLLSIQSPTTWDPLQLAGEVRWVRDARPGVSAGMGIAFDPLGPDAALALHRLFRTEGFEEEWEGL